MAGGPSVARLNYGLTVCAFVSSTRGLWRTLCGAWGWHSSTSSASTASTNTIYSRLLLSGICVAPTIPWAAAST